MDCKYLGLFLLSLNFLFFEGLQAERILFLIPIVTRSEKDFYEPFISELGRTGHSVTVVTSCLSLNLPENVTEIMPSSAEEQFGTFKQISKFSALDFVSSERFVYFGSFCHKVYKDKEFQEVISREYDLVISNIGLGLCFHGILHEKRVPYILMESYPLQKHFLSELGTVLPSSSVPNPYLSFTGKMIFTERLVNFAFNWFSHVQFRWVVYPMMEEIYREYLGNDVPSIAEIHRNASLIMMNTHFTSTGPKSLSPDVIEIGCAHCKPPKPLPQDLEEFVSESPQGFVYFSLGSTMDGSTLPNATREMILNVFSRRKERIIWKFDTGVIANVSKNVLVKKWLPQQDLLGHPKIRLFISQAGLLSTQQVIYHGVPALFLPVYFDQFSIAKFAEENGMALSMELHELSEEQFEEAVDRLLAEPKFAENAKLLSAVQREQMSSPVERAVFWTNFVLKFDGAPQLRSPARSLNIFQIYSLDVIATLLSAAAMAVLFLYYLFKLVHAAVSYLVASVLPVRRSKALKGD